MQILGLLGMYFYAVVVEVKKNLFLFRLAVAILWVCEILKFFDIHFDIHLALNLVCASLKCRLSTIFVCLYISLEN